MDFAKIKVWFKEMFNFRPAANAEGGYLPDENPSWWKLLLFALQQIIVMFPATVLVALLTGFHVSTTIFASGLATICFIMVTGRKIPLYYGSSFSYITAICAITGAQYGVPAADNLIAAAEVGIILSGFISIIAGIIIRLSGMKIIEKILPPTITGSIAVIIGLSLAGSAINNVAVNIGDYGATAANVSTVQGLSWLVCAITLISTICFAVFFKKGVFSQLPILLGLLLGYFVALIIDAATDIDFISFNKAVDISQGLFVAPHFVFPWQADPKLIGTAVLGIMPIAIATIPESTAHLYQLDIYVNKLAEEKNSGKKYNISDRLGHNLIGDGLGDIISSFFGGPAGTNYGENLSTMSITRNFSTAVLIVASLLTILFSFFTPLTAAVYSIPGSVIGGLSIYLFGVIACQGIAIMIEKEVNLFSAKNLAIIATILIVGIGGSSAKGFNFMANSPIAAAALFGIGLNLLFMLIEFIQKKIKEKNSPKQEEEAQEAQE